MLVSQVKKAVPSQPTLMFIEKAGVGFGGKVCFKIQAGLRTFIRSSELLSTFCTFSFARACGRAGLSSYVIEGCRFRFTDK